MDPPILPCVLYLMLYMGSVSMEEDDSPFQVSISGRSVKITCPDNNGYFLTDNNGKSYSNKESFLSFENYDDMSNGIYSCEANGIKRNFYIKAQVCDTCTEVSIPVVVGVLCADCLVTLGVALIVYFGCKQHSGQKRDGGMANGARQRGKPEGPPPVPNPDYEPIRKGQRDEYDRLGPRFK
ncbi:T-cell surface glycoprotein CD3 epsilon chain [Bombina bombina]|uniref:T-cell surface glycoprotein CD3 epsilon chain n=1 Tax=Bombina bombina TaxID=8345 RepID=UPI00235AB904|nr:T-cell surface glycoprotein CD3 epsilon chain [Bombina bombina]